MSSSASAISASRLPWQSQPAALLGWVLIVALMLGYAVGMDRTFVIDQGNYLANFSLDPLLHWIPDEFSLKGFVVWVFSEEVLWHVWTTSLGSVLQPTTAVVLTVVVLNLLIALSIVRIRDPVLPLLIWLALPVGFAATGLSLLRQGLALGVMLYIALRWRRPVLGTLIAATIHTTFVLAVPFAMIAWLCRRRRFLGAGLAVSVGFAVAYVGGMLFEAFGGRRLHTYDANQPDVTSIYYLVGTLLCCLPAVFRLAGPAAPEEPAADSRALSDLAVIHIGVIAFVATSFFVFPLGTGRVGYLSMLLLIPLLPTVRRRDTVTGMLIFILLLLYLVYLAIKTYLDGGYDVYFSS